MRLRAIFLAALALCYVGAGGVASAPAADASPNAAIAKIKQLGGKIELDTAGRVVKVDLMKIEISDADVQLVATLPDLQWLRLSGAGITDDSAKHLKGLQRLKMLGLLFTDMTNDGLACVENMTTLDALDLRGSARIGDPGLARLKKLTRLTTLKLQTTNVTDAGLDHLQGMSALTTLALEQAVLTPAGLEKVGKLFPKLEELSLLGCATVDDDGVGRLAALRRLRRLSLRGTQARGPGLAKLNAPDLEKLDLSQTPADDEAMANIARFPQLKWLNLWATQIDDKGMKHLAGLTRLAWLNFDNTRIGNEGIKHLVGLKALKTLNLRQTDIDDTGLEQLKSLAGLQELTLSVTSVTDDGVARLQTALPKCHIVK